MSREVPLRRSLVLRLLALSVLVSIASVAATAWLAVRTTTGAIRHEHGQALSDDARIYDALLGYASRHPEWDGVTATLDKLARRTDRRLTLTDQDRRPIAASPGAPERLPAKASAVVDPLAVDTALVPDSGPDRIDPRAAGPFLLPRVERDFLLAVARKRAECLRGLGVEATVVRDADGRPRVEAPEPYSSPGARCTAGESLPAPSQSAREAEPVGDALDALTKTEGRALKQLTTLTNSCLAKRRLPGIRLTLGRARGQHVPSTGDRTVSGCVTTARREQLAPYVAPAALLFVSSEEGDAADHAGFELTDGNRARIVGVTALVLLLTVAVTVAAGSRLVRPLHALTAAAQRMKDGDTAARVRVSGRDEIARLAMVFNDMSQRRAELEELRRTMVGDVAHELRTPLSNIRGWLEAAQDGVVEPDDELLSSLHEEALLLQHVIDDLRDLAAADAGELRLYPAPLDVADVLAQVASAHRGRADAAGIALRVRPEGRPEVAADQLRLRQAVGNLVSNALRHTPAGGSVTLSCRQAEGEVVIEVADTGGGIAAEDLPRVFERFWRADKSRNRRTGGSGLGLPIVRKLVEAHGGSVVARSAVGEGSVFTVRLPSD